MKLLDAHHQSVNQSPEMASYAVGKTSKEGVEIKPMDVLCGRGKKSFNHSGNRRFRTIIDEVLPAYVNAVSRTEKSEIVTKIVHHVREAGGRFLKREGKRGGWHVLNYTQSKEKAGHAIRDATITEDSKKERAKKRKLQRAAAAKKSREQPEEQSQEPSIPVVTPDKSGSPQERNENEFFFPKYEPEPVGSMSIRSALQANLKQKQKPDEPFSSTIDLLLPTEKFFVEEPFNLLEDSFLGMDPFMDYIDEVLGPAPTF